MASCQIETRWSVVVASGGALDEDDKFRQELCEGVSVLPVHRATKPTMSEDEASLPKDPAPGTVTLGVLSSPTDLIADLNDEEVRRLSEIPRGRIKVDASEAEYAARSRACKARNEEHCLLVLYVVQPTTTDASANAGKKLHKLVEFGGSGLPTGLVIALPANKRMPTVSYIVNSVMIDELEKVYEMTNCAEELA
jgi:hypothetical protein